MSLIRTPSPGCDSSLPDFDFAVLCDVWKEIPREKEKQSFYPSPCKNKCDGCEIVTRAIHAAMISSGESVLRNLRDVSVP